MSAFTVDDKTINTIVSYLIGTECIKYKIKKRVGLDLNNEEHQEIFADKLFLLNIQSVEQRYGTGSAKRFRRLDYFFSFTLGSNAIKALKSLSCLIYQCSQGDIIQSDIYKLLSEIEHTIAFSVISKLPEWQSAPWE